MRSFADGDIAGSSAPEQAGCFLCLNDFEMEWFVKTINTTGGPVDVWAVDGVDEKDLRPNERRPAASIEHVRMQNL